MKNIVVMMLVVVMSLMSCSCNGKKELSQDEVSVSLDTRNMVVKIGWMGDIHEAGRFISKDGKKVFVEYCDIYRITDAEVMPICRSIKGSIPEGMRADEYYYQLNVQPIINSLATKIAARNSADINEKDLQNEIQNEIDAAGLIYEIKFQLRLGIQS